MRVNSELRNVNYSKYNLCIRVFDNQSFETLLIDLSINGKLGSQIF